MESTAHSSSPQALRGSALRRALRRAGVGPREPVSTYPPSEEVYVYVPPGPIVFPEVAEIPDSVGPRALRPDELALWLERHR
jgi:hypothetical protein